MSKVWRRLQRVGKKASKFHFATHSHVLTISCDSKWQPDKVCITWTRRERKIISKFAQWEPGLKNAYEGIVYWEKSSDFLEFDVTLYRAINENSFEDKEWLLLVESEDSKGKRRLLATGKLNLNEYAFVEPHHQVDIRDLALKVASNKIKSASISFGITCQFIKDGKATDEDMISVASFMSTASNAATIGNNLNAYKKNRFSKLSDNFENESTADFNLNENSSSSRNDDFNDEFNSNERNTNGGVNDDDVEQDGHEDDIDYYINLRAKQSTSAKKFESISNNFTQSTSAAAAASGGKQTRPSINGNDFQTNFLKIFDSNTNGTNNTTTATTNNNNSKQNANGSISTGISTSTSSVTSSNNSTSIESNKENLNTNGGSAINIIKPNNIQTNELTNPQQSKPQIVVIKPTPLLTSTDLKSNSNLKNLIQSSTKSASVLNTPISSKRAPSPPTNTSNTNNNNKSIKETLVDSIDDSKTNPFLSSDDQNLADNDDSSNPFLSSTQGPCVSQDQRHEPAANDESNPFLSPKLTKNKNVRLSNENDLNNPFLIDSPPTVKHEQPSLNSGVKSVKTTPNEQNSILASKQQTNNKVAAESLHPTIKQKDLSNMSGSRPDSFSNKLMATTSATSVSSSTSNDNNKSSSLIIKETNESSSSIQMNSTSASKDLLDWCKDIIKSFNNKNTTKSSPPTSIFKSLVVDDYSKSWKNGLAFCAIIYHFRPNLIDLKSLSEDEPRKNLKQAFTATDTLNVMRVVDYGDILNKENLDQLSIMTYLYQLRDFFEPQKSQPLSPTSSISTKSPFFTLSPTKTPSHSSSITASLSLSLKYPDKNAKTKDIVNQHKKNTSTPIRPATNGLIKNEVSPNGKPTGKNQNAYMNPFDSDDDDETPTASAPVPPAVAPVATSSDLASQDPSKKQSSGIIQIKPNGEIIDASDEKPTDNYEWLKNANEHISQSSPNLNNSNKRVSRRESLSKSASSSASSLNSNPNNVKKSNENSSPMSQQPNKVINNNNSPTSPDGGGVSSEELIQKAKDLIEKTKQTENPKREEINQKVKQLIAETKRKKTSVPQRKASTTSTRSDSFSDQQPSTQQQQQHMEKQTLKQDDKELIIGAEYVNQELINLKNEQKELDKQGNNIERQLRLLMKNSADSKQNKKSDVNYVKDKEQEDRLLREWFLLVNRRNALLHRQQELEILQNEKDLEKRYEILSNKLRTLIQIDEFYKTDEQKKTEQILLNELINNVMKRNELVLQLDEENKLLNEGELINEFIQNKQSFQPSKEKGCVIQ